AMLLPEFIFDFGSSAIGDELIRYKENFLIVATRRNNFGHILLHFWPPSFFSAKCKRPAFVGSFPANTREPNERQRIGDRIGLRVNFAIASACRASMWQQIRAD